LRTAPGDPSRTCPATASADCVIEDEEVLKVKDVVVCKSFLTEVREEWVVMSEVAVVSVLEDVRGCVLDAIA
jgi:hypothetical protein